MAVTWAAALGWRLRRHFLEHGRAGSVEAVVDRLVAVPSWSGDAGTAIRLRLARPDEGDLAAATAAGRIFATYAFCGATHFMTPSSAAVHLALRSASRQWERPSWCQHYRLEPEQWPRLRATVRDALSSGPLTQHELAHAVAKDPAYRHLRSAFDDKSHTFLKPFGWQGDLCFGPSADVPTFRLLEAIPGWAGLARIEEAGPLAIRAYLSAYGPATLDRVLYWLAAGLSAGRQRVTGWIERMGDELTTVSIEGASALCLAEHADDIARTPESGQVVFLPGFDQWVLGAGTADSNVVPAAHRPLATRGANLILIGGRVRGTRTIERAAIRARWLDRTGAAESSSVAAAARRLSSALGRDLRFAVD
ncbi:DNA glycosylase AlkZ-like family protein [Actinokineospora sp. 24-640]